MPTFDFEQTPLWRRTLAADVDASATAASARERLRATFTRSREMAGTLAEEIKITSSKSKKIAS